MDLIEWRVDWYENGADIEKVQDVLTDLALALNGKPLLFTFRTKNEGGEKAIQPKKYLELNKAVIATKLVDLMDVEVFIGDEIVKAIIQEAHQYQIKVVGSNHDFEKTPNKDEIIGRLCRMQDLGVDFPKIAVMPRYKRDVLTLLEATTIMNEEYADRPIITMSMAGDGIVSRLAGEVFGSCITFGTVQKASAPGQIKIDDLHKVLQIIHQSLSN